MRLKNIQSKPELNGVKTAIIKNFNPVTNRYVVDLPPHGPNAQHLSLS